LVTPAARLDRAKPVDIRVGDLELRLAETPDEVEAAQGLRYRVFYEEMSAIPTPAMAAARRDFDAFDAYCDHLLVIDRRQGAGAAGVVGTYRLLRREGAARCGGFYSSAEYDIAPLLAHPGDILELGRSCVGPDHRSRAAMGLMWRAIAGYVLHYDVSLDVRLRQPRRRRSPAARSCRCPIYYRHLAPAALQSRALADRYVDMRMWPPEDIDDRAALSQLPPVIKGYLRLGGFVGDGAVVDAQFNTTDVCVVVKTDWLTSRYVRHYTRDDAPGAPVNA
jgi:putative hemolysin